MTRAEFISAARRYIGTPFQHQARLPGVGLDCAGVVVCALQECGYAVNDRQGYGRIPSQGIFTHAIVEHCDTIQQSDVLPGDLMMFAFRDEPQHIAVVAENNMLIHAYQDVGRVVENSLDATWQSRLCGCYRLRGIA